MEKGFSISGRNIASRSVSFRNPIITAVVLCITIALLMPSGSNAQTTVADLLGIETTESVHCLVPEAGAPSCSVQASPGSSNLDMALPQHVGNPINVITGNKYQYELDYQSINSGLALTRHYNSSLTDYDIGFGPGWRHTYQVVLTRVSDSQLNIVQSDGRLIHFHRDAENKNIYRSQASNDGYIEAGEMNIWHLTDGRKMQFQGSFLVSIDMGPVLGPLTMEYLGGKLHRVTDSKGEYLVFSYIEKSNELPEYGSKIAIRPEGSIGTITLPSGQIIDYEYAEHRNLARVLYSDDNAIDYKYEHAGWNSHLTERTTSFDQTTGSWSYDSNGLAVGWQHGASENGLSIVRTLEALNSDITNGTPSSATVTYADGRVTKYAWDHSAQVETADTTSLDITCDNCLPDENTNSAEFTERIDNLSEYDMAMDSLWSSLIRLVDSDNSSESTTTYEGTYPHLEDSVQIQLSIDRSGKVKNFRWGQRDLRDIVEQSSKESTTECSLGVHYQTNKSFSYDRIKEIGTGGEFCTLDDLVAVEFIHTLETFKENERNSAKKESAGGKAKTSAKFYDPMKRYCELPAGMNCTDLEDDLRMARLSECAYGKVSCEPEFRLVDPGELGMDKMRFADQGFDAQLYHDASRDRHILAFRGTDFIGDDWDANLGQARGEKTRQYHLALVLAERILKDDNVSNLELTGHSLGGGLATFAALGNGLAATVFNTAAVQPTTAANYGLNSEYQNANSHIRHIHTDYDPLTVIQEVADDLNWGDMQTAPGVELEIPNPDHPWMNEAHANATSITKGLIPVLWHSMTAVIHVLQSLFKYNCSA